MDHLIHTIIVSNEQTITKSENVIFFRVEYPYGIPQSSYMTSFTYPSSYNNYGVSSYNSAGVNLQYPYDRESYVGQSYPTSGFEYLPLPGVNRRRQQSMKSAVASQTDNAPAIVKRK